MCYAFTFNNENAIPLKMHFFLGPQPAILRGYGPTGLLLHAVCLFTSQNTSLPKAHSLVMEASDTELGQWVMGQMAHHFGWVTWVNPLTHYEITAQYSFQLYITKLLTHPIRPFII